MAAQNPELYHSSTTDNVQAQQDLSTNVIVAVDAGDRALVAADIPSDALRQLGIRYPLIP